MRARRQANGETWDFDGKTITVRIPITFVRRGGRKVIVAPDGTNAWALARPTPDEALIRALGRAHRWKRLLDEGTTARLARSPRRKVSPAASSAGCSG